jgi:membrane-bound serine protease (ClpP class)
MWSLFRMTFFINPNVSYVLLVLGFMIAVLALLAPGTGILEIAALMTIALAGYGIANLPINWWASLIIALSLVPLILLFRRSAQKQAFFIALSSLLFTTGAAFLYDGPGWLPAVNLLLVLFMVPLATFTTWIIAKKTLEAAHTRPVFNLDDLIGMTGQAKSDIREQGSIHVNGEEWTARSQEFIPAGSPVRVIRREGFVLEVELVKS